MRKYASSPTIEVGDSVVVKAGIQHGETGEDMGGWQGRVTELDGETLLVAWDSATLRSLPPELIDVCEIEGLSWEAYYLGLEDVEKSPPRDSKTDAKAIVTELSREHAWVWLGEEGRSIREVLRGIDPADEAACVEAWYQHLQEVLEFPFIAHVFEFQEYGPLQSGDRVRVIDLAEHDNHAYGVLVEIQKGRLKYVFPLCDLEVVELKSPLHEVIRAYAVWFANRF